MVDRVLPRSELMEIAWHEVPLVWEAEVSKLDVSTFGQHMTLSDRQCPETPDEETFRQTYGVRIQNIYRTLVKYRGTRTLSLIHSAYSDLYRVSRPYLSWLSVRC